MNETVKATNECVVTYDVVVYTVCLYLIIQYCMAENRHMFTQRPSDDCNKTIQVRCSFDTELGFGVPNRLLSVFKKTKLLKITVISFNTLYPSVNNRDRSKAGTHRLIEVSVAVDKPLN